MLVTAVQAQLYWEQVLPNLAHLSRLLQTRDQGGIIVLPEMFSTGFTMNPEKCISPALAQQVADWMANLAKEKQALVLGSCAWPEQGRFLNRLLCFDAQGPKGHYDKKHLFALGGESEIYSAGNHRLVLEHENWRICPLICYDLRFPIWARNRKPHYDLLIYVANWPDRRIKHWQALLPARAIENQSYVLGVNRAGIDGNGLEHSGMSALINPMGEKCFELQGETCHHAHLDKGLLLQTREQLPFLRDADAFQLD